MTARRLRVAIEAEARQLARLEALVGIAALGAEHAADGHDGVPIDGRDAWEAVAAAIHDVRVRLHDLAEVRRG